MEEYKNLFSDSIRNELKFFTEYRTAYQEIYTFRNILSVLQWDSEITLPEEGRAERGLQIGLLSGLIHSKYTGENFYKLAAKAREENEQKFFPAKNKEKLSLKDYFKI